MRPPSLPPPIEETLARALNTLVRRLSKILVSSLRGAANLVPPGYVPWKPPASLTQEGCVVVEGWEFCFNQVRADVEGGWGRDDGGRPFRLRGGNSLERVVLYGFLSPRGFRVLVFVLEFGDEEHPLPIVDTLYRMLRLLLFARTRDVEAFLAVLPPVSPPATLALVFPHICSGGKTFASRLGAHGTCVEVARGWRVDVFVSNVWNHAMSTHNTNPGLEVVRVTPRLVVGEGPPGA